MNSYKIKTNQLAFTMVELLIVTLLLSMIMAVGTYSYSLFTTKWQKELGNFNHTNQLSMNIQKIERILSNIQPYVLRKKNAEPGFFFIGSGTSLLAVTHDALFSSGVSEAFRLSAIKNTSGKFDLVYQSMPLLNTNITTEKQTIEFVNRITLLNNLDNIYFRYYGWPSFRIKSDRTVENLTLKKWYETFSGLDNQLTPEKLELFIVIGEKKLTFVIELDKEPERWLSNYFDSDT